MNSVIVKRDCINLMIRNFVYYVIMIILKNQVNNHYFLRKNNSIKKEDTEEKEVKKDDIIIFKCIYFLKHIQLFKMIILSIFRIL